MFINEIEEESENLIDDDADTCVNLAGSDGCRKDRVWNLFMRLTVVVTVDRVQNLFIMFSYKGQSTEYILMLYLQW